jgi:hypothetical protein
MTTMRPADYDTKPGCHDCYHAFHKQEWEEATAYYCTLSDNGKRPRCGSVFMKERFHEDDTSPLTWDEQYEAWEKWSEPRAVAAWGFCDAWEGK